MVNDEQGICTIREIVDISLSARRSVRLVFVRFRCSGPEPPPPLHSRCLPLRMPIRACRRLPLSLLVHKLLPQVGSFRLDQGVQLGQEGDCPHQVAADEGENNGGSPESVRQVISCVSSTASLEVGRKPTVGR